MRDMNGEQDDRACWVRGHLMRDLGGGAGAISAVCADSGRYASARHGRPGSSSSREWAGRARSSWANSHARRSLTTRSRRIVAGQQSPGRRRYVDQRRSSCCDHALVLMVLGIIAGVLGASGVAVMATNFAYILFVVALVLFVVHLATGRRTLTP